MSDSERRELDAFCAEHVMGCKRTENPDDWTDSNETLFWHRKESGKSETVVIGRAWQHKGETLFDHSWETFHPTTDPAAAMEVLRKCLELGRGNSVIITQRGNNFMIGSVVRTLAEAETLPLAICLFAKNAFSK